MITAKANCTSFNLNVQHFFLISAYYLLTGWGEEPDKQQGKATTPSTAPSCIATKAATKAYSTYAKKSCRPAAAASPVPAATFPTKYYTPTTTSICPPDSTRSVHWLSATTLRSNDLAFG